MVVKTSIINSLFKGVLIRDNIAEHYRYIIAHHTFKSRTYAENHAQFKQVIPYAVIKSGHKYLLSRCIDTNAERRSIGEYSLGFGGHVTDHENSLEQYDIVYAALRREINEELEITWNMGSLALLGLISDDGTSIGTKHVGILFQIEVKAAFALAKETHKMTIQWATSAKLKGILCHMDPWSQTLFRNFISPNK